MKHYSLTRAATALAVMLLVLSALSGAADAQLIGGTVSRSGPAPGEEFTALAVGFFVYSKTDLSLPGPMPIDITRVYRSSDVTSGTWNNRDFGTGTSLNYDIFLYSNSEAKSKKSNLIYTDAEVVMPDGGMIECLRSDTYPENDYINATFACNQQPTGVWFGSTITFNVPSNQWDLKRPDGTTYKFGFNSPLQSITDRYNNSITITRGPVYENGACMNPFGGHSTEVPSGSVAEVASSNGRAAYFCYDDSNNPTDITGVADNANPTIKKVLYTYTSSHRLSTATQYAFNSNATTTYQWNQGSAPGVGDITTIIVNHACLGTNCGSPKQVYSYMTYGTNALGTVLKSISSQLPGNGYSYTYTIPSGWNTASKVQVSLPDGANRYFYFDNAGYVIEDVRNLGLQSVNAEYTLFNRGQQTIGTSGAAPGTTEFVGQVQEESYDELIERTTTYNYGPAGNLLTMALSPAPGQTSGTATWTNTYTTYNRLASAAEPLSYGGVGTTYSYNDNPSQPTITVTDPLGRITTVTENAQGQPISVKDPMGYTSTSHYTSAGDLESIADPLGNTTTFQPDADGRTTMVTSPLGESSTFKYDALDNVTDIYDPLGNHTNYTY
ncbi:MAG TPA: DUF6531 domain-containing protein, partial [Candidatus Binataceae bacterium]|nr:DUF6531 domain-containing protein [Candidatus Binataceae bacterium]